MPMDDPDYAPKIRRMFEIVFEDLPRIPLWQPALSVAINGADGYKYCPSPARHPHPHYGGELSHGGRGAAKLTRVAQAIPVVPAWWWSAYPHPRHCRATLRFSSPRQGNGGIDRGDPVCSGSDKPLPQNRHLSGQLARGDLGQSFLDGRRWDGAGERLPASLE